MIHWTKVLLVSLACCSTPVHAQTPLGEQADWQPLFNGSNLDGWTPKITGHPLGENFANTFRVEQGLLKVRYDQYTDFGDQFGHLFYQTPFSHYALHVRYRFVGDQATGGPGAWAVRNSGVMLHSQNPASMTLKQAFPDSIEAQFLGGLSDGKPRPTANLCTPGTHVHIDGKLFTPHCTPANAPTLDGDQWVDMLVIVLGGGRIRHFVNGSEVLTYTQPVLDSLQPLQQGYIALQSESHPIDFSQVRLLSLEGCTDPAASNFQAYAVKSKAGSCHYD